MIKVFISYSHQDEPYRKDLEKHVAVLQRNGYIDTWTDREIEPGEKWNTSIHEELISAKIILLLVSSDFLASDFCYDIEMKTAVQRHQANEAIVIPIILRFCDWKDTPFSKIQALPSDGKPIKDWPDTDKAFLNVVDGIKLAISSLNNGQQSIDFKLSVSAADQLIEFRRRVLSAKDEFDFRKLRFDLNEFKESHPQSFELEELEHLVEKGLQYEQESLPKAAPLPPIESAGRANCVLYFLLF